MRAAMQLVVVVVVVEEKFGFCCWTIRSEPALFDAESEGLCVVERGGSYAQIVSVGNQFCGFRFGHGGGGIFVDAGWGIYWVTSVTGGLDAHH